MYYNEHFFTQANGKRRSRTFEQKHLDRHVEYLLDAFIASKGNGGFLAEQNAGTVSATYCARYGAAVTSRAGVYVHPETGEVVEVIDAVEVFGSRCPSIYEGGLTKYREDWEANRTLRNYKKEWR